MQALIRKYDPDCLFLLETELNEERVRQVIFPMKFLYAIIMPFVGLARGLCFCWK